MTERISSEDTPWTPGPWKVQHAPVDEYPSSVVQRLDESYWIAETEDSVRGAADAHLVALAPEMAKMLADFVTVAYADKMGDPEATDFLNGLAEIGPRARALLARARGDA